MDGSGYPGNMESSAQQAGIDVTDKPAPLFQLFTLTQLLSHRISTTIAVNAERELIAAGYTTAARLAEADWQDVVDTLGRAHFKRYDESTASRLIANAKTLQQDYRGDLRKLAAGTNRDSTELARRLQQFQGIGPTGADIFLREVRGAWPWVRAAR